MPIKDRTAYPKNWKEISLAARERAGNRCEECGAANHAWGYRLPDGTALDLLDRVLAGGVVIVGDITLSIAEVDLVRVSLRALVTSISGLMEAMDDSQEYS